MHTICSYYACFSNGWHSLNDSFAFLTHDSKIAFVGSSPLLMSSHGRHFLCVTISLDAKHMAALVFYPKPKVKRMYRTAAIQALLSFGARSLNVMLSCTMFVHVRSAATMHCAHAGAGPITGIQCVGSRLAVRLHSFQGRRRRAFLHHPPPASLEPPPAGTLGECFCFGELQQGRRPRRQGMHGRQYKRLTETLLWAVSNGRPCSRHLPQSAVVEAAAMGPTTGSQATKAPTSHAPRTSSCNRKHSTHTTW